MQSKKTVVIGASEKKERYSRKAVLSLLAHGHPVFAIGARAGWIETTEILSGQPQIEQTDTLTIYLSPENQVRLYPYLLSLRPNRIILNPGAENPELEKLAREKGIEVIEACTLVLLSTGQY